MKTSKLTQYLADFNKETSASHEETTKQNTSFLFS